MEVCVHCSTPLPDGSQFCSACGTPVPGRDPEAPTLTPQGREIFERLKVATEGRYDIQRELGRGGMAVVFLGYQKSLDRMVAIKVLLPLLAYDPEIVERFMREARTQGKLDHPNIIQVFEVYNEGGLTFFTVPYISGESLRTYLKDDPKPSIDKVRRYLRQAADALAYAHRRGVVHRDVKPDNIMVDKERDRLILTDFGIAKALAAETTLTTPGDLLGTPQYMSPEQGEGRHDLDGRADQYSLGLIGYEMLAGHRPFQADNLAELMYKHRFEDPVPIDDVRPDAPLNLRRAVSRAICKDRDERFATIDDFVNALDAAVVEEPEAAKEDDLSGADDTTVMIPTPPKTPRPGFVGSTTPETSRPPQPPDERERRRSSDPAERWTPPKGAVPPWQQTPAEPVELDESETVLLGSSLAEKRTQGLPRGVLIGTGAVAAVLVGALFLLGPLRPGTGGDATNGQPEAELTPGDLGTTPGDPTPEAESERTGDDPTAGGDQAQAESGAETGGAETETPTGEVTPPPVVVEQEDPTADGNRAQAENARNRARQARATAVAAGAEAADRAALDGLDARMTAADAAFGGGRFWDAWESYSSLIRDYGALTASVRGSLRTDAEEAQRAAQTQREAAVAAVGADAALSADLQTLENRLQQANAALRENRVDAAGREFTILAAEYEALAVRATSRARQVAIAARDAMRQQREAAISAGAADRAADRLATGDGLRDQGQAQFDALNYADASTSYGRAEESYRRLATDLAAEPETPPAAEVAPEAAVGALIVRFTELVESESIDGLGSEVYQAAVPGNDADFLNSLFGLAENIEANSTVENIQVEGTSATAEIRLDLSFLNSRSGQRGSQNFRLRLSFVSGPGGWRLESFRRR